MVGGYVQVSNRMGIMNRVILILAVAGGLFWQCTEVKEINPEELGANYFPLQIGTYRTYQVDGAIMDYTGDSIEFSYLLKESVVDSFQNLEGGISYRLERQKQYDENDLWEIDSVWTARVDGQTAVRIEHNVPVVSLIFPLAENKTWDGNKLNNKSKLEFEMINIGQPFTDSFGSFGATVTVIQQYLPDVFVTSISKKEIYSKDKGLVYKENIILKYKQDGDYGDEIVESSLVYYQYLLAYGEE